MRPSIVRRFAREEGGFTLVEMIVVTALLLVSLTAIYSVFDTTLRILSVGQDETDSSQEARVALERMEREIRGARSCNPSSEEAQILSDYGEDSISFCTNTAENPSGVSVTYSQQEQSLYRREGSGDGEPLADLGSGSLSLAYLRSDGSPCSDEGPCAESDVGIVRVELEVVRNQGEQTIVTNAALRNRAD